MATFTHCLNNEQVKDYLDGELNLDDILKELSDEMIAEYLKTGEREFTVELTKYAGYSEKHGEAYEDDIDSIDTDIQEILTDYVEKEDLIEILEEAVSDRVDMEESLKEIVNKFKH